MTNSSRGTGRGLLSPPSSDKKSRHVAGPGIAWEILERVAHVAGPFFVMNGAKNARPTPDVTRNGNA